MYSDADLLIICGDFNARLGNLNDAINSVDDILPRIVIDNTKNNHGESLQEFLHESRMCVLNGRLYPLNDGFTSSSTKGAAVVDYIICPQDNLQNCEYFDVKLCSDVVFQNNLQSLIGERCKIPDHAILTAVYNLSFYDRINNDVNAHININANVNNEQVYDVMRTKHKVNKLPTDFMKSEMLKNTLLNLIRKVEINRDKQNEINECYNNLCETIIDQMNKYLPRLSNVNFKTKKRYKPCKPFWDENLEQMWLRVRDSEKIMNKCKCKRVRSFMCQEFKDLRNKFDKMYRKQERAYNSGKLIELDEVCVNDPNTFWNYIKQLGPKRKQTIPLEVYKDKTISCDKTDVLNQWKHEYEKLYKNDTNVNGNNFVQHIIDCNTISENEMYDNVRLNDTFNGPINYNEVKKFILCSKNKKACGIDRIPNEVLKNDCIIEVLFEFFNLCFDQSTIPNVWLKAIIFPIPKSKDCDPRLPLNYRGISLLSCISKIYSKILNNRLSNYLEDNNLLVSEQNGFRKQRSCQDHLFSLNAVVKNRLSKNMSTYAAFIDLRKAFDCVNREFLYYKLGKCGIVGKLYFAIKSLYKQTESCVQLNDIYTDWFNIESGVRQGDSLSPTLFALYVNDLAKGLNKLNLGIDINGRNLCVYVALC